MAISDKQKNILLKNGYTLDVIDRMDYKQVSKVIGDIFDAPKIDKQQAVVQSYHNVQKEDKPKQEYHLTPEQVRSNALEAAQRWYPNIQDSVDDIKAFWLCVHEFEKYISS